MYRQTHFHLQCFFRRFVGKTATGAGGVVINVMLRFIIYINLHNEFMPVVRKQHLQIGSVKSIQ